MKDIFTIPKLSKSSTNWFVFFRFNGKLYQRKEQLNRIKDLVERERKFLILCEVYHDKLKEGWNPEATEQIEIKTEYTLIEALRFALEKKKPNISPKTYSGYNGSVNFLETSIINIGLKELKITECKRVHVKLIMEKAKELNAWSNKAHNKHLNHFKAVLSELLQWDIIENSPAFKVDNLKVSAPDANKPASKEDMAKIRKELENNHYNFYVFCMTIFFTLIRPEEILKIKLSMVNLKDSEITLPPEITKTNKKRVVPISPFLLEYYKKLQFENLPKDYYLFGANELNHKHRAKQKGDFIPAPNKIKRDTATRRWETLIKKGLGIQMNMYALKHHGANMKILAGLELDSLREL